MTFAVTTAWRKYLNYRLISNYDSQINFFYLTIS
jgi:hypothetical protein